MRRDVINTHNFEIVEEEENHDNGVSSFHQNIVVMTHDSTNPKHHDGDDSVDDSSKIFIEIREYSQREEKPCLDAEAENHHLEYVVRHYETDEESISDCETMLLSRPTVEIVELDDNEDTNKINADDEEIELLNELSKIIVIHTPEVQVSNNTGKYISNFFGPRKFSFKKK